MDLEREQMNIVIVGHVDHGKSTVIGRLLADTGSLPKGKLDQVRANCARNAKPFEYAFLLDALKDEQAQGITIDTARCFFKTPKRHYIIIDAPGHIEFLKNMITGAARAEAALLVIDANEGIQENSRRHGFMLAMLGIRQIVVLVNKMDLVDYSPLVFQRLKREFTAFLKQIHGEPKAFVPISARDGDNLAFRSPNLGWYQGPSVVELMDSFAKEKNKEEQSFRFPVQAVYKFTEAGDNRRIIAGTIETGRINVGDEVIFLPSRKRTHIQSIAGFNEPPRTNISAGRATGFELTTQVYIKPGELMCRIDESLPFEGCSFRAHIFWMGKQPMVIGKKYKLKLATSRTAVYLQKIHHVLNSADLTTQPDRHQVERHEVADCVLQTVKPLAFDLSQEIEATGRFVLIDNYEIVGGGIITEALAEVGALAGVALGKHEFGWEQSNINPSEREARYHQKAKLIVITGGNHQPQKELAQALEMELFREGFSVYYLGMPMADRHHGDIGISAEEREEQIAWLGELAHIFTAAGLILITTIPDLEDVERELLTTKIGTDRIAVICHENVTLSPAPFIFQIAKDLHHVELIAEIKEWLAIGIPCPV